MTTVPTDFLSARIASCLHCRTTVIVARFAGDPEDVPLDPGYRERQFIYDLFKPTGARVRHAVGYVTKTRFHKCVPSPEIADWRGRIKQKGRTPS